MSKVHVYLPEFSVTAPIARKFVAGREIQPGDLVVLDSRYVEHLDGSFSRGLAESLLKFRPAPDVSLRLVTDPMWAKRIRDELAVNKIKIAD